MALEGNQDPSLHKKIVGLSVPEISLLSRLFYETGHAKGNRNDMLRFICRNYSTAHTANIPLESLGKKYYQVARNTQRSVRRMLQKMVDYLDDPNNFN